MMVFQVKDYRITVLQALEFMWGGTDNRSYEGVFDFSDDCPTAYKALSVQVEKRNGTVKESVFVVPYYYQIQACALPSGDNIFLMLNHRLLLFDPDAMRISRQKELESTQGLEWGIMESAHAYKHDFILYGENEIFRIAPDLSTRWQFASKSIFMRYNEADGPAFEMKSDRICLYDFYDNYYELNYDGTLLQQRQAEKH